MIMLFQRIATLLFAVTLIGCYGTMAPAPLPAAGPPPGLTSWPGVTAIPSDLAGLLRLYRVSLLEKAHHLPTEIARQQTEIEVGSLARQYRGRDDELKAELVKRLQLAAPSPAKAPRQPGPGPAGFPSDPDARDSLIR